MAHKMCNKTLGSVVFNLAGIASAPSILTNLWQDEPKDETDANGEVTVSCPPGWDHSYEQESMIANGIATTRISQTMLERDGTGQYYHEYYEQRALPDEQSATIASQNRTALETVGPSNSVSRAETAKGQAQHEVLVEHMQRLEGRMWNACRFPLPPQFRLSIPQTWSTWATQSVNQHRSLSAPTEDRRSTAAGRVKYIAAMYRIQQQRTSHH